MAFSSRCSLLRTVGAVDLFVEAFELGVGFGPVTVNQHSLDLVLLDAHLTVVGRRSRRLWSEDDVIDELARVQARSAPASTVQVHDGNGSSQPLPRTCPVSVDRVIY